VAPTAGTVAAGASGGMRQGQGLGGGRLGAGGVVLDGHDVAVLDAQVGVAGVGFGPPDGEVTGVVAAGGYLGRIGGFVAKLGDVVGGRLAFFGGLLLLGGDAAG
jgi:hypothetical protein